MKCGATEYRGTTLGTTNQAFWYILLHLIEIEKWIKCLFYKGFRANERKRVRYYDNITYTKVWVSYSKDRFVVNGSLLLLTNIIGELPALRAAAKRQMKSTNHEHSK